MAPLVDTIVFSSRMGQFVFVKLKLESCVVSNETPIPFSVDRDDKCTISYQLFSVVRELKNIVDRVRSAEELTDTVSSNALECRFIRILNPTLREAFL